MWWCLALVACRNPFLSQDEVDCGEEACNGIDDDCDGRVDEAGGQWFVDQDGDGFGGQAVEGACDAPPDGATERDGDCDDGDPSVSPGAVELCDDADLDEDCDGLSDDADPSAEGKLEAAIDRDGDGFGSGAEVEWVCDPGPEQSTVVGDCDDSDPARYPGANEDGVGLLEDWACDGYGGVLSQADCVLVGEANFRTDRDADVVLTVGDLDGDGLEELAWYALHPTGSSTLTHTVFLFSGASLRDCERLTTSEAAATLTLESGGSYDQILAMDDLTGDGVPEFGVFLPMNLHIFDGAEWMKRGTMNQSEARWIVGTSRRTDAPRVLGDVDEDGLSELVLFHDDTLGVLLSSALGDAQSVDFSEGWLPITLTDARERSVQLGRGRGDLDGDGVEDILMLWHDDDTWVWVLQGAHVHVTGIRMDNTDAVRRYQGSVREAGAGFLGDHDGDGLDDIWLGGRYPWEGSVHVHLSTHMLVGNALSWSFGSLNVLETSSESDDGLSSCVVPVGDMDGDGLDDLLICAPDYEVGAFADGAAFLFLSSANPSGDVNVGDAQISILTDVDWQKTGILGATAGDFDGDGRPDLAFSSEQGDEDERFVPVAYVVFNRL